MSSTEDQIINLPVLNLPHFEPVLRQSEEKFWIFDSLRKKYLVLTPEEWVRQHWINYLIHHHNYSGGLFSLEKGLKYNQLKKRTDLVVFTRDSTAYLLVECKAPSVKIDEKSLSQIMTYNKELNCPNLILSNGIIHLYLEYSDDERKYYQRSSLPKSPI